MAAGVIGLAADHAAFELKRELAAWLKERGWTVRDFGAHSSEAVDYPDLVVPCARALAAGELQLAVVACGSGIGASICANKVAGVRAALCLEPDQARLSRQHNDANCLALSGRLRSAAQNLALLEAWLGAAFEGGRHAERVRKIHESTQC